jgi:hypothetical protein
MVGLTPMAARPAAAKAAAQVNLARGASWYYLVTTWCTVNLFNLHYVERPLYAASTPST